MRNSFYSRIFAFLKCCILLFFSITVQAQHEVGSTSGTGLDVKFIRNGVHAGIISEGSGTNDNLNNNTALGLYSLLNYTQSSRNVGIGVSALQKNTTGCTSVAVGYKTLYENLIGKNNVAVGAYALQNNKADNNVGLGFSALMKNTIGTENSAFGYKSLFENTTGNNNLAFGSQALLNNSQGNNNTAVGRGALLNSKSSDNTAVGTNAGSSIISGGQNLFLGNGSGSELTSISSNNVIIGSWRGTAESLNKTIILSDGEGQERFRINSIGNAGLGTSIPNAKLEINSQTANESGLMLTQLADINNPTSASSNGKALSVDANGKVILTDISNASSNTNNSQYYYGEWTGIPIQAGVTSFDITQCPITNWTIGVEAITPTLLANSVTMNVGNSNAQVEIQPVSSTKFRVISNVAVNATITVQYPGIKPLCNAPIISSAKPVNGEIVIEWNSNGVSFDSVTLMGSNNNGSTWEYHTVNIAFPIRFSDIGAGGYTHYRLRGNSCVDGTQPLSNIVPLTN
ncbi:MAG: hypothetical protein H6604_07210 [Flavobacteriales bacterium]|nr:hypothetical protein [Flavobacteriales bacterium]